jgi:hypothetical protein
MKVVIMEKMESGQLVQVDNRDWSDTMVAMLNHSNYLLVDGKEYEMVEGRLNVNDQVMEILVLAVKNEAAAESTAESTATL